MMTPTLNLNGSSPADLLSPRMEAVVHLLAVRTALQRVTPNGRDYPGDPEALQRDRELHFKRLEDILLLSEELMAEGAHIKGQVS
jgi:hypothetical protein